MKGVKFGLLLPQGWRLDLPELPAERQYEMIEKAAIEAEELGFDSIWFYDHFVTYPTVERSSCFEAWTLISSLSRVTNKVRLGTLVTCNSYRHPPLLAKMVSVLDVLSSGRIEFGVGAGWYVEDYRRYGYSFPPPRERIGALDEALQIMKGMWKYGEMTFKGKYYSVEEALNFPMPLQRPWPPITVGGSGEKLTLKVVAKHADRWNSGGSPDFISSKLEVLKKHCIKVGRDFEEIEKSYWGLLSVRRSREEAVERAKKMPTSSTWEEFTKRNAVGNPEDVTTFLSRYLNLGVRYFMLYIDDSLNLDTLRLFAETVMPNIKS